MTAKSLYTTILPLAFWATSFSPVAGKDFEALFSILNNCPGILLEFGSTDEYLSEAEIFNSNFSGSLAGTILILAAPLTIYIVTKSTPTAKTPMPTIAFDILLPEGFLCFVYEPADLLLDLKIPDQLNFDSGFLLSQRCSLSQTSVISSTLPPFLLSDSFLTSSFIGL